MQAAIGYQHAAASADARIAAALEAGLVEVAGADDQADDDDGSSGTLVPAR
jgi:hypothetical protein